MDYFLCLHESQGKPDSELNNVVKSKVYMKISPSKEKKIRARRAT